MTSHATNRLPESRFSAHQPSLRVLSCSIADHRFAFRVEDVVEIIRMASLSRPPGSPSMLLGFLDIASTAIPVVSLAHLLGLPESPLGIHTPIIIVRLLGAQYGLVVDRVHALNEVPRVAIVSASAPGITNIAARIDQTIAPIVSIADLLLVQERQRISELQSLQTRRLAEVEEARA